MKKKQLKIENYIRLNVLTKSLLIISFLMCILACVNKQDVVEDKTKAVYNVLEKLIGSRAKTFKFKLNNTEQSGDTYNIEVADNIVNISGSSQTALCYAAYNYLKDIGAVLVSWEGHKIDLPNTWPEYSKEETTPFTYRKYLNVCTYGYTTPWWDWERWSKEIDWMALHGINMPTAMEGQEAVWQALWKEYGLTDSELESHFAGPAFLPWQRMGNINSHDAPLPQTWISKKKELQKNILQKMKSLGMYPVVPGFSGYVPKAFVDKYPNSKIRELSGWSGGGFKSTYLLDPKDSLFKEVGKRFIEIYTRFYGEADFYLADAFNEITPPVSENNKNEELSEYGKVLYETINEAAPQANWVMQGWLFGHDKSFWTKDAANAFLSKVPNDKMIIQDFGNDRYKVWETQEAFYNKQWTYGYVHNYGGSNPVYGDLKFYKDELTALLNHNNKGNLKGYGVMPEGLNNNSVVYEYLYDLPWTKGKQSINDWLNMYLKARYKTEPSSTVFKAWELLIASVYSTKYWTTRWWDGRAGAYLSFKRPTTKITTFEGHSGDKQKLEEALKLLTKASEYRTNDPLFLYDLQDALRHYHSICLDDLIIACVKAYQAKDINKADDIILEIEEKVETLDAMFTNQPKNKLSYWLQSARNYGETEAESMYYVKNAKKQITLWGGTGNLNDYASKSWEGMYGEFYWPRWRMFFKALKQAVISGKPFDEASTRTVIQQWESSWCNNTELYK